MAVSKLPQHTTYTHARAHTRTQHNTRTEHTHAHTTQLRALTQCGKNRSDALAPVEENAPFFRRDYGGIQGRKKNGTPLGEIYFIGIIDILTTYSYGKSAENFVKSLFVNKVPPSCVCARARACMR